MRHTFRFDFFCGFNCIYRHPFINLLILCQNLKRIRKFLRRILFITESTVIVVNKASPAHATANNQRRTALKRIV